MLPLDTKLRRFTNAWTSSDLRSRAFSCLRIFPFPLFSFLLRVIFHCRVIYRVETRRKRNIRNYRPRLWIRLARSPGWRRSGVTVGWGGGDDGVGWGRCGFARPLKRMFLYLNSSCCCYGNKGGNARRGVAARD